MSTETRRELPGIPDIRADQRGPAVALLLEHCHRQQEQIQALRDEIARLKGQKPTPLIRPSALAGERSGTKKVRRPKPRGKRSKTAELDIHELVKVQPAEAIPPNSRFKGYQDFVVQELRIGVRNTRYRLERWVSPEGVSLIGQWSAEIGGVHFGPQLRAFIPHQYHHAPVTQPLLLEQLREWQIDISAGQISALITDGHGAFHRETDALLQAGLQRSRYVHVDDTGARHQGRNGYCTHIGTRASTRALRLRRLRNYRQLRSSTATMAAFRTTCYPPRFARGVATGTGKPPRAKRDTIILDQKSSYR